MHNQQNMLIFHFDFNDYQNFILEKSFKPVSRTQRVKKYLHLKNSKTQHMK